MCRLFGLNVASAVGVDGPPAQVLHLVHTTAQERS